jgi:ABC-type transporter MlaC component
MSRYGMGRSVKADQDAKTKKAITEYVGHVYGHNMKMLKGQQTKLEKEIHSFQLE